VVTELNDAEHPGSAGQGPPGVESCRVVYDRIAEPPPTCPTSRNEGLPTQASWLQTHRSTTSTTRVDIQR